MEILMSGQFRILVMFYYCETQHQVSITWVALYSLVVCLFARLHGYISIYLVMTLTETKTYKKTKTKTKTQRHRQRQKQSAFKTHCMLYLSKAGSSRIWMWYWLSSCDKDPILCFSRAEHFSGVNIFQGWIFFSDEYFSGMNIFQERIFFSGEYLLGVNIFQDWLGSV